MEREALISSALLDRSRIYRKLYDDMKGRYITLRQLCDAKRSYEVPPEYSGVLNIEGRDQWSPTDTELARVLVSCTYPEKESRILYADLVRRLDLITSLAKPHIYRSLKVILRKSSGRSGVVEGISLRG